MRIPPSVIVMSLLTAAPFGLAIRDTLNEKNAVADEGYQDSLEYDGRGARRDREAYEEYEREMQRDAEERARKREQRAAGLDKLYGKAPASMGAVFDGVVLGANQDDSALLTAHKRIVDASRDGTFRFAFNDEIDVTSVGSDVAIVRVAVEIGGHDYDPDLDQVVDLCASLRSKLVAAWGPSLGGTWVDRRTHQRATLDQQTCTLTFDKYVEAREWLDALSIDAVGKRVDKVLEPDVLAANADSLVEDDDGYADWSLPGLGIGADVTKVSAGTKRGKVVDIEASTTTDFDSVVAVRNLLTERLRSRPKLDDESGAWVWKRKVPVELSYDDQTSRMYLLVGKSSWE